MPSSPWGPWRSGSTTTGQVVGGGRGDRGQRLDARCPTASSGRSAARRRERAGARAASAAMASSARTHCAVAGDADGVEVVAAPGRRPAARGRPTRRTRRARPTGRRTARRGGRGRERGHGAECTRRAPRLRDCRRHGAALLASSPPPSGGRLDGPDVVVDGASIDSRTGRPGPAVRAGGGRARRPRLHRRRARRRARRPTSPSRAAGRRHGDRGGRHRRRAAGGRAARPRRGCRGPVVGITGSVGKTSVKDLLAAVLAQRLRTAASERSFNNELGVPLTLLDAPDGTEAVVVEMGARGHGPHRRRCARSPARPSASSPGWPPPTPRCSAPSTTWPGPRASWSRRCRPTAPRCSTPTTSGWRRWRRAPSATVVTFGAGGDVRADGRRARRRAATPVPPAVARGATSTCALAVRGRTRWPTPWRPPRPRSPCGVAARRRGRRAGRSAALSPWRMELGDRPERRAACSTTPTTPTPPRWPPRSSSLAALPAAGASRCSGVMAELGAGSDEEHAAIGALAAAARHPRGRRRRPGLRRARTWPTSTRRSTAARRRSGPSDAVLVKGSRVAGLERLAAAPGRRRTERSSGVGRLAASAARAGSRSA